MRNYIDAIEYDASQGTMIALVPRDGGKPVVLQTDSSLHLHLSNAYEQGDDTVVELVNYHATWEQLNGQLSAVQNLVETSTMPYGGTLSRVRITPAGTVRTEQICDLSGEFPPST